MHDAIRDSEKRAVVTVGEGRGFIVETGDRRLVITAAHCLPHIPPAAAFLHTKERTYAGLLGPLGERKPEVSTECLFADPVADIAVLGEPDDQVLYEQAAAYNKLMDDVPALRIADPPPHCPAWLLTLDARWVRCDVRHNGGPLWLSNASEPIMGGVSGSPIIDSDGAAFGVMCTAGGTTNEHTGGGPNPKLVDSLPGWLLRELAR